MKSRVDAYLAKQPPDARRVLKRVRTVLRQALRGGEEVISYGMPAIKLHGRIAVYFAGWKNHWSLYPISKRIERELGDALARLDQSHQGTIRFSYEDPVPVHLIARIARVRARELAEKQKK